jgi:hypothetical protein
MFLVPRLTGTNQVPNDTNAAGKIFRKIRRRWRSITNSGNIHYSKLDVVYTNGKFSWSYWLDTQANAPDHPPKLILLIPATRFSTHTVTVLPAPYDHKTKNQPSHPTPPTSNLQPLSISKMLLSLGHQQWRLQQRSNSNSNNHTGY